MQNHAYTASSLGTPFFGLFFASLMLMLPAVPAAAEMVIQNGTLYPNGFSNGSSGGGGGSGYSGSGSGGSSYPLATSMNVSCAPSTPSAQIGEVVVWFSSVTGGSGDYTYFWGGSDGLNGNQSSVRYAYSTSGSKFGTVTVVSNGQSVTANCNGTLIVGGGTAGNQGNGPGFGVSCFAAEDRIAPGESGTWLSVSTGLSATATTTYSWDGTDNLFGTGPSAFKTYTSVGRKFAILTVTSGNLRSTVACTNHITVAFRTAAVTTAKSAATPVATTTVQMPALQGVCSASLGEAEAGREVIWTASAIGGTGAYTYKWEGDEGLSGTATTTSKVYETAGEKNAAVTITSGDKTIILPCPPAVTVTPVGKGVLAASFFSWKNPLLFILAALIAIGVGMFFAVRRRHQEEEEEDAANEKKESGKH